MGEKQDILLSTLDWFPLVSSRLKFSLGISRKVLIIYIRGEVSMWRERILENIFPSTGKETESYTVLTSDTPPRQKDNKGGGTVNPRASSTARH